MRDVIFALRTMRRRLTATTTAILVIAIGIGANTAMFTVVNKVLLDPLPYPESDRLVQLQSDSPMGRAMLASVPKYLMWREGSTAFEYVAAYGSAEPVVVAGAEAPQLHLRMRVSADYFPVFGVQLALGRVFTAADDVPRGPRVVVISHGFWQRRFGRDRSVLGRSLHIENDAYEVTGVAAADSPVDPGVDLWMPLQVDPNSIDHSSWLQVVARLRPGVTPRAGLRQVYGLAGEFHRRYPNAMGPREAFGLTPLREVVVGESRSALFFLLGSVTFVLLIACANVANLALAQTSEREREFSLRAALGARPRRIVSQLLIESVLLSLAGGLLGLAIGHAGLRWLLDLNPGHLALLGPTGLTIALDGRVLAFTIVLIVLTTLMFGLYPAWRASRLDLNHMMGSGATQVGGARQSRLRAALVVIQVAGALVLLVGAGLLIRTFVTTRTVPPGFVSNNVLTLEMPVFGSRFGRTADMADLVHTAEQRVAALYDVAAAAAASSLPLEPGVALPFVLDRRPLLRSPYHGTAQWRRISRAYFNVLQIDLQSGRPFTRHDIGGSLPVAIVNEAMARKFWPGTSPLNEQIRIGREFGGRISEPTRTIVGVVADVRDTGLNRDPEPMVYVPIAQVSDSLNAFHNQAQALQWVVRTHAAPNRLSPAIERELRASGRDLVIGRVSTMDEIVAQSTAQSDFNATVLTLFAAVSLMLSATGLYGLMAHSIEQRTREIGVRIALGATPWRVRAIVLMEGLRLTLTGVFIGAIAAVWLTRYMAGMIYGVQTLDPTVFTVVAILLIAVAMLGTILSSRRATSVQANVALRH